MLLGESVQRLDVKNRVTLPARLRAHFAQGVVVSKGFDGCLFVFSPDGWEAYVDAQLGRLDPLSRRGREMSRWLYGGASETELDRQGRVMLPPAQLTHAGLERDIVVAGSETIWRSGTWRPGASARQSSRGAWRMLPNLSHSSSGAVAHVPVMAVEVAELLEPRPGDTVVDCTFGAGGHAAHLEPLLGGTGMYVAVDRDASVAPFYERFAASASATTRFVGGDFAPRACGTWRRRAPAPRRS